MKIIAIEESVFESLIQRVESLKNSVCENKDQQEENILLSSKEVMELLGVGSTTLQKYRDEGKLSFIKIGNTIRYCLKDINNLIDHNK